MRFLVSLSEESGKVARLLLCCKIGLDSSKYQGSLATDEVGDMGEEVSVKERMVLRSRLTCQED